MCNEFFKREADADHSICEMTVRDTRHQAPLDDGSVSEQRYG